MAGRQRQPIAVLEAKGKSHLSKEEKERRRAQESTIPPDMREIQPPDYLLQWPDMVKAFDRYAEMLKKLMPENFGEPDAECLARYVVAEDSYERLTEMLYSGDPRTITEKKNIQIMQDRAFRQAHACASVLGLTVTSRCKLIVPGDDDDGASEF